jgi:hypothetical protein
MVFALSFDITISYARGMRNLRDKCSSYNKSNKTTEWIIVELYVSAEACEEHRKNLGMGLSSLQ